MTENKPTPAPFAAGVAQQPKTPEEVSKGKKTVTMVFKKPVRLTTRDGVIDFPAGVHEVPEDIASHEYLKLSGATVHENKPGWMESLTGKKPGAPVFTQRHVDVLTSVGVPNVKTEADAEVYYNGLTPEHQKEFLEYTANWQSNSQYELQRRVQDAASGATESSPPNHKGDAGGPEPSAVNELIDEGAAAGMGDGPTGTKQPLVMTEDHRAFFEARGFPTPTVADAQKRYDNFSPSDQVGFAREFEGRQQKPPAGKPASTTPTTAGKNVGKATTEDKK